MPDVILLTPEQLQGYFDRMVQKVEELIRASQKIEITSKEWLTAKEVCELLKISHTTLHDWSRKGSLKKHKIGDRIRFRNDEVLESLQRIESKIKLK